MFLPKSKLQRFKICLISFISSYFWNVFSTTDVLVQFLFLFSYIIHFFSVILLFRLLEGSFHFCLLIGRRFISSCSCSSHFILFRLLSRSFRFCLLVGRGFISSCSCSSHFIIFFLLASSFPFSVFSFTFSL